MSSRLLIDGYNLLFASNVFAPSSGPATLERTRTALLDFIASALEAKQRARTTVVFDATHAPPGLPHELVFADMRLLFSRNPNDADALIEQLLDDDRAPRELLVVSSDHRVQRAARQHGAKYLDSDVWFRALRQRPPPVGSLEKRPEGEAWQHQSAEIQAWLSEFADIDSTKIAAEPLSAPGERRPPATEAALPLDKPLPKPRKPKAARKRRPPATDDKPSGYWNPFPPGYGEDASGGE